MRIAFIAPYQGSTLIERRPVRRNLSLGARAKIEMLSESLASRAHTLEILSNGEVVERQLTYYPGLSESKLFDSDIPIKYSSAVPIRFVSGFWSSSSTLRLLKKRHRIAPFDVAIIYNLNPAEITCAQYALKRLDIPVILEYEDDQFLSTAAAGRVSSIASFWQTSAKRVLASVSGCLAGSPQLLAQAPAHVPKLLLPGVIGQDISAAAAQRQGHRPNWVVFSGTHSRFQGLEPLIEAWKLARLQGWELHIAGQGELTERLKSMAQGETTIVFHGILSREENADFLSQGKLTVVAYDISKTQGFSFKTLECLGAGMHVITTRLSALDGLSPELRAGLTYLNDTNPKTIAECLGQVIRNSDYKRTAEKAAVAQFGPVAVSEAVDCFVRQVVDAFRADEKRASD